MGCFNLKSLANVFMPNYNFSRTMAQPTVISQTNLTTYSIFSLVMRFYDAFGDGSSTAWQNNLPAVTAFIDDNEINSAWIFRYNYEGYPYGGSYLGFDQFAQYLAFNLSNEYTKDKKSFTLSLTAPFQKVAYLSLTVYNDEMILKEGSPTPVAFGKQETTIDSDLVTINGDPNPYMYGNRSVMSYISLNISESEKHTKTTITKPTISTRRQPTVHDDSLLVGQTPLYRLDKYSSHLDVADDIAEDGCSKAYLFGYKTNTDQEMFIVRMKVPFTFFRDYSPSQPDMVFDSYQTRYFSVSANQYTEEDTDMNTLPLYWTVNSRMLRKYMDADGYAYVFLSPNSFTLSLAAEQVTSPTEPPVMTWGKYTGFVLGDPSYALILRYRAPNIAWEGSPEHAKCYSTPQQAQPIHSNELGEYTPEVFTDTLEAFRSGHIGAVQKDSPWPIPSN